MATSSFRDILRDLLAQLRRQYEISGDFNLVFGNYKPLHRSDRNGSPDDDMIEHDDMLISQTEYLYAEVVNKYALHGVKISTMIRELEKILQVEPPT